MKRYFFYLFFLLFGIHNAQTAKSYAEQVINRLTSAELAGRGYTDEGMNKTAIEIASQFEKGGVLPLNNTFFQEFTYPINIIEKSKLKINGKELKFGSDYLVGAGSPSLKGSYTPVTFNTSVIDSLFDWDDRSYLDLELDRINKEAIVFPDAQFPENLIVNETTAAQFYRDIPQIISQGGLEVSTPLIVQQTSAKFIHSLSPIQTKTVDLFVSNEAVPEEIKNIDIDLQSTFSPEFKAKNVIGYLKGERSDSIVVLTAHYDHLGKINDVVFPGANDNASGVALLLSLARTYSKETPKFDMIFIAFAGEEAGLMGSKYFVDHPLIDLKKIKFLINFDMVGTGEEGIQVVNGKEFPKQFNKLENISYTYNYLKQVKIRGSACNSDHCPFYEKGVPSFFIYTLGGKSGYHDIEDSQVSLYAFDKLVALFTKFINQL